MAMLQIHPQQLSSVRLIDAEKPVGLDHAVYRPALLDPLG